MFSHLSQDAFAVTLQQRPCKDVAARCENSEIKWLSLCIVNALVRFCFLFFLFLYEVYHPAVIAATVSDGIFIQELVWPLFALCSRDLLR